MERRKSVVAMLLLCVAVFACAGSMAQRQASKPHPLIIEEQGSFAVGGSVIIAPGTFDPIRQGAFNPAGADPARQTCCMATMLTSSIRSRLMPENFRSSSDMATGSPLRRGRPPRTGARAFKPSSCAAASRST